MLYNIEIGPQLRKCLRINEGTTNSLCININRNFIQYLLGLYEFVLFLKSIKAAGYVTAYRNKFYVTL